MFKTKNTIYLLVLLLLLILTACSATISEEQDKAKENAVEAFEANNINPNNSIENFSVYLPSGMDVDESDPNNIVLSNGSKLYLLFINPNENESSKVIYETTLNSTENIRLKETFEKDNRFGFIIINDVSEDLYELTVGIGGTKLTTETDAANIAHEAKLMMEIVSSIEFDKAE
ncbi:hypothetical protein OEV98_11795 [Caldibacillus lycopersici]|uniref:DUF4367 domain-containing protein n=1 Tax=Perspicuibacillus lycopersici TaxID=1325689 RepID=A0AAE3LR56_9BACI|nr:hypothetical protein [Perspicuibacillus lycopersici]MCU9614244.1 hypothetical protein [Perspicuibacillus lycopersici]